MGRKVFIFSLLTLALYIFVLVVLYFDGFLAGLNAIFNCIKATWWLLAIFVGGAILMAIVNACCEHKMGNPKGALKKQTVEKEKK